jgi:hypothetical protein
VGNVTLPKEQEPKQDFITISLLDGTELSIERARLRGAIEPDDTSVDGRWSIDPFEPTYQPLLTEKEKDYPEGTQMVITEDDLFVFILPEVEEDSS